MGILRVNRPTLLIPAIVALLSLVAASTSLAGRRPTRPPARPPKAPPAQDEPASDKSEPATFEAAIVRADQAAGTFSIQKKDSTGKPETIKVADVQLLDGNGKAAAIGDFAVGAAVRVTVDEKFVWELASKAKIPPGTKEIAETTVGNLKKVPPNLAGASRKARVRGWIERKVIEVRLLPPPSTKQEAE